MKRASTRPNLRARLAVLSLLPAITATAIVPAAAQAPSAAQKPETELIVFSSQRGGHFELWSIRPDGSALRKLTDRKSSMPDYAPAFSPDGRRVSFVSYRRGGWRSWAMNRDGSGIADLLDYPTYNGDARWAPEGGGIAFTTYRPKVSIRLADDRGKVTSVVTDSSPRVSDAHPSWFPDGDRIVFTSNRDGDFDIYSVARDGSNPRRLTDGDGQEIAPSISPDGEYLLFTSIRNGLADIAIQPLGGGPPRLITDHRATGLERFPGENANALLFREDRLTAAWSPDGLRIVFCTFRDGNFDLYIVDRDGSRPRRLTRDAAFDGLPTWGSAIR